MPSFSAELVDWLQPGGIGAGLAIVWTETRAQGKRIDEQSKRIDELRDDMKELRAEHKAATTMVPWPRFPGLTPDAPIGDDGRGAYLRRSMTNPAPLQKTWKTFDLLWAGFGLPCHGKAFHKGAALGRWGAGLSLRDRTGSKQLDSTWAETRRHGRWTRRQRPASRCDQPIA